MIAIGKSIRSKGMKFKIPFYPMIILILSLFAGLSCQLISRAQTQVKEAQATAQALATEVKEKAGVLGTVQAAVTEVVESEAMQTARALATEKGPALEQTLQAFTTQEAPRLQQTADAVLTAVAAAKGQPPEDIPLVEGERKNFVSSALLISYETSRPYSEVLDFYKQEMAKNGWVAVAEGSVEAKQAAFLNYKKGSRRASVSLSVNPLSQDTIVLIMLSEE
jgi:hypothetical protein